MFKLKSIICLCILFAVTRPVHGQVFTIINNPTGMTYDRDGNVWVTSYSGNKVVKLQGDGSGGLLATGILNLSGVIVNSAETLGVFPVGAGPTQIICDCGPLGSGALWVTNSSSNNVTKLDKTGTIRETFDVQATPRGLTADSAGIWVANSQSNSVTLLDRNSGATLGTFFVGAAPYDVASDGTDVWVANHDSNTVMKLAGAFSASGRPTGTILNTIAVADTPTNLVSDGTNMWVSNYSACIVTKIQIGTGVVLDGNILLPSTPGAIVLDAGGGGVWTANYSGSSVTAIDKNVDRGPSFADPSLLPNPYGLLAGASSLVLSSYTGNIVGSVPIPFRFSASPPPPPPPPPSGGDPSGGGGSDPSNPPTPQVSN